MKNKYYNKEYFNWQKNIGEFGGIANVFKFEKYINNSDNVIDFGCGGGFLLKNIKCKDKIGIEINSSARKIATKNGIKTVSNIKEIKNGWADVIISNHVLEHIDNPIQELELLNKKINANGKVIFVVPFEIKGKYKKSDINKHLYTWSPQNLANLFERAGYNVLDSKIIKNQWPPCYIFLYKIFGIKIFTLISYIYGLLFGSIRQTIVVATK